MVVSGAGTRGPLWMRVAGVHVLMCKGFAHGTGGLRVGDWLSCEGSPATLEGCARRVPSRPMFHLLAKPTYAVAGSRLVMIPADDKQPTLA